MPAGMYNPINDPVAAALAARLGGDAGSVSHVGVKSRVPGDPGSPLRRGPAGYNAGSSSSGPGGAGPEVVPNANFRGPTSYRSGGEEVPVNEPSLDGAAAVEARVSIALARRKLGNR